MKCRCCFSLRSAVYFGSSIHIFVATMAFGVFLMQSTIFLYLHFSGKADQQSSLTLVSFVELLVGASFLPLGCLIFKGVEKESLRLIKWPVILMFLLKLLDLVLKLYRNSQTTRKRFDWEARLYEGFDVIGFTIYFLILFFYGKKLAKEMRLLDRSDYFQSPAEQNLNLKGSKYLNKSEFESE
ncbi:unnamed protein product [Orchesella dallaii]|uniref:Uncharacterized protein n=1 Tax=Orchesella dallaii TaxID=48710 RepID=A0ABP1QCQ1_9HEXA